VSEAEDTDSYNKLLNFAFVCMQIAYPYIYNQLSEEPDFKQWNESIAAKLKLRKLTVEEQESLNAAEEFDEEWEKILYRMCQKETHLSNRVFQVSGLLNKIAAIVNNDAQLGETVESTMALSAVTNLKAFDSKPRIDGKRNRDTSNYKFNGKVYTKKVQLVHDLVMHHLSLHPNLTHEQLKKDFFVQKNMDVMFMSYDMYLSIKAEKGIVYFYGDKTLDDTIALSDTKILISSNWPTTNNGKPAVFMNLLNKAKELGYLIVPC
jgi:hypothetical protein